MKIHKFRIFDIISIASFLLSFVFFYFNRTRLKYKKYFENAFIFLLSGISAVFIFKIPIFHILLNKAISQTYVRRFFYYGLYSYILMAFSLYFWFFYFYKINQTEIKKIISEKNCKIANLLLLVFIFINLFFFHIKNDKYNHNYIIRKNNVYNYIKKNLQKWSVICSYGYPALFISSQTPNYIISGHSTHLPSVKDRKQRDSDMYHIMSIDIPIVDYFILLQKYDCKYILLEKGKNYYHLKRRYSLRYFSLLNTRKKICSLSEIFSLLYQDDTYVLYKINDHVDLEGVIQKTKKRLNDLLTKKEIFKAYSLTTKLLLIKRSKEHYKLNEMLRRKLYNIDREKSKITYSYSFFNIKSNINTLGFPNNLKVLFDKEGYPELKDKIYFSQRRNVRFINKRTKYIEIDFNTIRQINEIRLEWLNFKLRGTDYTLSYFDGKKFIKFYEISNNKNLRLNLKLNKTILTSKIRLNIIKIAQKKFALKNFDFI